MHQGCGKSATRSMPRSQKMACSRWIQLPTAPGSCRYRSVHPLSILESRVHALHMRYFIYCRKSSEAEDRQVASIESQLTTLQRTFGGSSDIEIVAIYEEAF